MFCKLETDIINNIWIRLTFDTNWFRIFYQSSSLLQKHVKSRISTPLGCKHWLKSWSINYSSFTSCQIWIWFKCHWWKWLRTLPTNLIPELPLGSKRSERIDSISFPSFTRASWKEGLDGIAFDVAWTDIALEWSPLNLLESLPFSSGAYQTFFFFFFFFFFVFFFFFGGSGQRLSSVNSVLHITFRVLCGADDRMDCVAMRKRTDIHFFQAITGDWHPIIRRIEISRIATIYTKNQTGCDQP
jgi:hypothetical protein